METKTKSLISGAAGPLHSRAECEVFAGLEKLPSFDGPCPEYSAVNPLRILALKESNSALWARVDLLMDHVQEMSEDEREMWGVRAVKSNILLISHLQ